MIYLVLAILCSSAISIGMRISENYIKNNVSMLAVNYIVCLLIAFAYTGVDSLLPEEGLSLSALTGEYGVCLLLGAIQGALFLGSFLLLQYNISRNGVVLSSTFMRLGVLVPTSFSILVFHEQPTVIQIIGFITAIIAILLISLEKNSDKANSILMLILLLFGGGFTDVMAKIYDETGAPQLKNLFLLATFVVAAIACILLALFKGQRFGKSDILFGIIVGIPNYFVARCLLLSLSYVPAIVAYPTFSVATIVLLSIVGVFFFKEKIRTQQKIAIAIVLVAIALLNM